MATGARGALTFWRRSIQARVVASTVLLSAVVVGVVGWLLLQQTRDGLLDQRVAAVVAEVVGLNPVTSHTLACLLLRRGLLAPIAHVCGTPWYPPRGRQVLRGWPWSAAAQAS